MYWTVFRYTLTQHVDSAKYDYCKMFAINCALRHMTVCGNIFCDGCHLLFPVGWVPH